jgi:lysozyme
LNLMEKLVRYFNTWEAREMEELKLDEGCRLEAYKDSEGIWTIGYGHTPAKEGQSITPEQAGELLDDDFGKSVVDAEAVCAAFSGLDGPRKGVLVNMAFNLGRKRLSGFRKFLEAVNVGEYEVAAHEMLDSKWAKQVGKRANRLAYRMQTGSYALRI